MCHFFMVKDRNAYTPILQLQIYIFKEHMLDTDLCVHSQLLSAVPRRPKTSITSAVTHP